MTSAAAAPTAETASPSFRPRATIPTSTPRRDVERVHAWPASHCSAYIDSCCGAPATKTKRKRADATIAASVPTASSAAALPPPSTAPLQAAVAAHLAAAPGPAGLWLGRLCRTASHEVGHCFGLDHCVYYACAMQGTACVAEDARQPPYLCPIDVAKVLRATGAQEADRDTALLAFCRGHSGSQLFAAYAAWLEAKLATAVAAVRV